MVKKKKRGQVVAAFTPRPAAKKARVAGLEEADEDTQDDESTPEKKLEVLEAEPDVMLATRVPDSRVYAVDCKRGGGCALPTC